MVGRRFSSSTRSILSLFALTLAAATWAGERPADLQAPNVNLPEPGLITAGQPTAEDLAKLKAMGVTKIISLRAPGESIPFDEAALVESLGMEYTSLPIAGAKDVTLSNARELSGLLAGEDAVFLHCASSNRVGALMALRAYLEEGLAPEQALAVGKSAGLGSLQEHVLTVMESASN